MLSSSHDEGPSPELRTMGGGLRGLPLWDAAMNLNHATPSPKHCSKQRQQRSSFLRVHLLHQASSLAPPAWNLSRSRPSSSPHLPSVPFNLCDFITHRSPCASSRDAVVSLLLPELCIGHRAMLIFRVLVHFYLSKPCVAINNHHMFVGLRDTAMHNQLLVLT